MDAPSDVTVSATPTSLGDAPWLASQSTRGVFANEQFRCWFAMSGSAAWPFIHDDRLILYGWEGLLVEMNGSF